MRNKLRWTMVLLVVLVPVLWLGHDIFDEDDLELPSGGSGGAPWGAGTRSGGRSGQVPDLVPTSQVQPEPTQRARRSAVFQWKNRHGSSSTGTVFTGIPRFLSVVVSSSDGRSPLVTEKDKEGRVIWHQMPDQEVTVKVKGFRSVLLGPGDFVGDSIATVKLDAGSRILFEDAESMLGGLVEPGIAVVAYKGKGFGGRGLAFWHAPVPLSQEDAVEAPDSTPLHITLRARNLFQPLEWHLQTVPGEVRILRLDELELSRLKGRLVGIPPSWRGLRWVMARGGNIFALTRTDSQGYFEFFSASSAPLQLFLIDASGGPSLHLSRTDDGVPADSPWEGVLCTEWTPPPVCGVRVLHDNGTAASIFAVACGGQRGASSHTAKKHPGHLALIRTQDLKQHDRVAVYADGIHGHAVVKQDRVAANRAIDLHLKRGAVLVVMPEGACEVVSTWILSGKGEDRVMRGAGRDGGSSAPLKFAGLNDGTFELKALSQQGGVLLRRRVEIRDGRDLRLVVEVPGVSRVPGRILNWKEIPAGSVSRLEVEEFGTIYPGKDGSLEFKIPTSPMSRSLTCSFVLNSGLRVRGSDIAWTGMPKRLDVIFPKDKVVVLHLALPGAAAEGKVLQLRNAISRKSVPQLRNRWTTLSLDSMKSQAVLVPRGEYICGTVATKGSSGLQPEIMFGDMLDVGKATIPLRTEPLTEVSVRLTESSGSLFLLGPDNAPAGLQLRYWTGLYPVGTHELKVPHGCTGLEFVSKKGVERRILWGDSRPPVDILLP